MDDNEDDTHLCLRCSCTITGLENYIIHRKGHCSANKQVQTGPQTISRSPVHNYEPSSLRADDFFSSLELQSTQVTVTSSASAAKSLQAEDDFDEGDDSDNDLYPPQSHTGGKWKPGWRPDSSTWKCTRSLTKQSQDVTSKSEDQAFYCLPCDRRYRDKYSFLRHASTPYHIKRSVGKRVPCKRSSRRQSSKLSNIIEKLLDDDVRKGGDAKTKLGKKSKASLQNCVEPEVQQRVETAEFSAYSYGPETHPYVQCVDPLEVMGKADCVADVAAQQSQQAIMSDSDHSEGVQTRWNSRVQKDRLLPHVVTHISLGARGKSNKRVKTTDKHMKRSSETTKTRCPFCSKIVNKLYLKFHLFTHTGERPFQCHLCGRKFAHRSTLSTHIKHHLGLRRYPCNRCSFRAVRPSMLRRHQNSVHNTGVRERTLCCQVCGSAHSNSQSLKRHVLRHNLNLHRFPCDVTGCTKSFASLSGLKIHSRLHDEHRTFLCDTCGFSTATMHQLTIHKRKHTAEHPFKCEFCNFSASRSGPLQRHLRIHTGAKPYKCPHCDYACSSQENIRKHVLKTKKHAGKKMYICPKCPFDSNEFSIFKDHLRREHSTQQKQPSASLKVDESPKKSEETLGGTPGDANIDKGTEVMTDAGLETSGGPPSHATSFEIRESCGLTTASQSNLREFRTAEPEAADSYSLLRPPVCQVSKELSSVDHSENRNEVLACFSSVQPKMLPKNLYLLEPSREPPVFYISSSDFSGLGSSFETATLGTSPARSPVLKTYKQSIATSSVESSATVEHVDPASCVLLPELHEELGVQLTDTVGVTQLDGSNAVYICMPLNGP